MKHVTTAGWQDVPHLTEADKADMLASYPPHMRRARTQGLPVIGSGAVWPAEEEEIIYNPREVELPAHWPRLYSLDVGWNVTAALWGAWDRDADVVYLYSEHYRGHAEPPIHAAAIKARGEWIHGEIDPAARGRSQVDGQQLLKIYKDLGLKLHEANNAREAGIYEVWTRLSTGRLKVSMYLENWLNEWRLYSRDEKGRIPDKIADHLMDDTRYLCLGLKHARVRPADRNQPIVRPVRYDV